MAVEPVAELLGSRVFPDRSVLLSFGGRLIDSLFENLGGPTQISPVFFEDGALLEEAVVNIAEISEEGTDVLDDAV